MLHSGFQAGAGTRRSAVPRRRQRRDLRLSPPSGIEIEAAVIRTFCRRGFSILSGLHLGAPAALPPPVAIGLTAIEQDRTVTPTPFLLPSITPLPTLVPGLDLPTARGLLPKDIPARLARRHRTDRWKTTWRIDRHDQSPTLLLFFKARNPSTRPPCIEISAHRQKYRVSSDKTGDFISRRAPPPHVVGRLLLVGAAPAAKGFS